MADFHSSTRRFERSSPVHWLLPAYTSAVGTILSFRPAWSVSTRSVLDLNQNAGCGIFGHNAPAIIEALEALLNAGTPLRLPLARCIGAAELSEQLVALSSPALGDGSYDCILGMRTGADGNVPRRIIGRIISTLYPEP